MPRRSAQPRRLKPRHSKFLAERAVAPEVAEARGYWTLEAADEFRALGWATRGRNAPPKWLRPPGLVIPAYSALDLSLGEENSCYAQFRPDRPARDQDGKVRKYVNPSGSQAVVDVNPAGFGSDLWFDRDVPLFIVEGVPKGDACWTADLPAVSIQGVWNFTTQDENHFRELLPDLRYLPVSGREVVIAFDADAWTNSDVRAAARELARVLSRGNTGASKVSALRLPNPEKKTGVDDFLVKGGGKDSVLELVVNLEELAEEKGARLLALSDVEAVPPDCLWEPYQLRSTLGFLDGAPGVGKTWIALALAAAVTKGGTLPSGWRSGEELSKVKVQKGNVVYLTQENSPASSLRPRFDRLKGDPKRFFIQDFSGDEDDLFTLKDLGPLRKMVEEVHPTLVVLDPIMNFIGENTDAHRDNEVRPILSRLMLLAENEATTIMGVRHLRKAATGSAVYAAGGSVAFSGAARSVVLAAKHFKEGIGEIYVMAHSKTNETPMGATLEYEIHDEGKDEQGFYQTSFVWKGRSDVRADELVSDKRTDGEAAPKVDRMKALISQLLDANPQGVAASTIATAAEQMGISEKTVRKAASELRVVKERVGGAGKDGKWMWRLEGSPRRKKVERKAGKKKY